MKILKLLVLAIVIGAIIVGAIVYYELSNPVQVLDVQGQNTAGGPSVAYDQSGFLSVAFDDSIEHNWLINTSNSTIEFEGAKMRLVWSPDQEKKTKGLLGYKIYRQDRQIFAPGRYQFKLILMAKGKQMEYEGAFVLQPEQQSLRNFLKELGLNI